MTYLDTLIRQRHELISSVQDIAVKAETEGRGFTDDERKTCTEGLAKSKELLAEIRLVKEAHGTATDISALMSKADGPTLGARHNATELGGLFAKAIGLPVNTREGRGHFDADGTDREKAALPGITDAPRGRVTVPTLRRSDGGSIFWAPQAGSTFLDLMPLNPLGPKDTTYKVRRQVVGDRARAASTVKVGGTKPTGTIPWETVDNRARQFAVLSEALDIVDFKDVPFYGEDASNLLASDLIWAIEQCIVSGDESANTGDLDDFDGLLNITGVRAGAYNTNPWRSIRSAITVQEDSGIPTSDLVIHMRSDAFEAIETATTEDGKPLFDNLVTGARREKVLYGVRVRTTSHAPDGQAILGAWGTTQLNVRDGVEVDWSDDGLFDKNQLRLRSETRVSADFTVPSAFTVVDLEAPVGG